MQRIPVKKIKPENNDKRTCMLSRPVYGAVFTSYKEFRGPSTAKSAANQRRTGKTDNRKKKKKAERTESQAKVVLVYRCHQLRRDDSPEHGAATSPLLFRDASDRVDDAR